MSNITQEYLILGAYIWWGYENYLSFSPVASSSELKQQQQQRNKTVNNVLGTRLRVRKPNRLY